MNKFITFFFIIISQIGFAQQKNWGSFWRLNIVDSANRKGIENATISIDKKKYFISDGKGKVDIKKNDVKQDDTIKISCVGYTSLFLTIRSARFPDSVKLRSSITILKEVKISSAPGIRLGTSTNSYVFHRIELPSYEYAEYIPNPAKIKGTIRSVEFVLNDELHGIDKPFAVRLYSKQKNSLFPDKKLVNDSLIFYNREKRKKVSIDISGYNIPFPENGVIAVFATLPRSYYGTDTVWYDKKLSGAGWYAKVPGIDMFLKSKDNLGLDPHKEDRNTPYCMVRPEIDTLNFEEVKDQFYVFANGTNLAISITVEKE